MRPIWLRHERGRRFLTLQEYQSMELLRKYEIPTPKGQIASSRDQILRVAKSLGTDDLVVKAQVLSGGRGKGVFDNGFQSGVHVVYGAEEAVDVSKHMIGHCLMTKQTGSRGILCKTVYVAPRIYSRKEYYLALLLDRRSKGLLLIGSSKGGVDIEAVSTSNPSAIMSLPIPYENAQEKLQELDQFLSRVGIHYKKITEARDILFRMITLVKDNDVTLFEINPFAETAEGSLICLDAKIIIDDNAEFRNRDLFSLRDESQEDPREIVAAKQNLNYIGLDGQIGCLVNGAGLAMATMDIIKMQGGSPANFLDVGGSATQEQVEAALEILSKDRTVNAIFINIFGGIMRCDVIAKGIISAVTKFEINVPIVARLLGTNMSEAKTLLKDSKLKIFVCEELSEAALKAVNLSKLVEVSHDAGVNISIW